jgi:hypothetical protein
MTRDPARIDLILADLRRYWHAAPDLRLGQMVMGLLDLSGAPRYGEFHAEDDKVAAYLAAWAAANPPPPDHRDALPPEIEAAIADAGQALVDAWDSAQGGPPHRFAVFVDPEGDPEVAAGWMAMARMHAAAIAAAREAGRREVLDGAAGVEEAIDSIACRRCGHDDPMTISEADRLRAAIAADKAALDATWRAHDLERDAEVAQAQAATHEACAALQAICDALHVTPPTGSTYCTEAVTMVVERVAADKARAVEAATAGMRPIDPALAARIRQVAPFDCVSSTGDGKATLHRLGADTPNAVCSSLQVAHVLQDALLAALTGADAPNPTQCGAVDMLRGAICPTCGARKEFVPGPPTGEIRRQMDAAAVEMCADCVALTGAGGGR